MQKHKRRITAVRSKLKITMAKTGGLSSIFSIFSFTFSTFEKP